MEGFKVLHDSRQPRSVHLPAKCAKTGRDILIRLEYEKDVWWFVYASETVLPRTGTDGGDNSFQVTFENGLHIDDDYACPCCKNRSIVSCGACGRITCWDGGMFFICGHCGSSGEVTGSIKSAQAEKHLPNGKK